MSRLFFIEFEYLGRVEVVFFGGLTGFDYINISALFAIESNIGHNDYWSTDYQS